MIVTGQSLRRLAAGSLSRNGLFALGQSLTVTVCLFLAYRLVIAYVGLDRFGIWSLLLAGSAFARIGDISGGGALARFVALAERDDCETPPRNLVHTVVLTSLTLNAVIGLAIWIAAPVGLPLFVAPEYLAEAQALIPYVVASMVIGALAVAVTSGIDGAQRADQRAIVVSVASLVFLLACLLLVPRWGVIGFGAAQVLQQAAMLALGWLVLRRYVHGLGWLPRYWQRAAFAETTGYAIKLNAIGIMGLMFEPLAKFTFNHAGGPGLVALYELASRLVVQIRSLVIGAATPLVPAFAAHSGTDDLGFQNLLRKTTKMTALAAIGATLATLASVPVISLIILGKFSSELLVLTAALTAGWSLNILVIPIYFAAQAVDVLRWNFTSHAIIATSVIAGALLLVPEFGSSGLVSAIIAGLVISMLIVLFGNARALHMTKPIWQLRWTLFSASVAIIASCLIAGGASRFLISS